jgi:hypothetical protein
LLDDYLKAMDSLTIDERNKLKKRIDKLEEKNEDEKYIIKAKLQEKDEQIEELKNNDKMKEDVLTNLSDQLMILTEKIKELEKRNNI